MVERGSFCLRAASLESEAYAAPEDVGPDVDRKASRHLPSLSPLEANDSWPRLEYCHPRSHRPSMNRTTALLIPPRVQHVRRPPLGSVAWLVAFARLNDVMGVPAFRRFLCMFIPCNPKRGDRETLCEPDSANVIEARVAEEKAKNGGE